VEIGVLEEDYSYEWASRIPLFAIPKKNGAIWIQMQLLNLETLFG
jgi:hypothetical protein